MTWRLPLGSRWVGLFFSCSSVVLQLFFSGWPKKYRRNTEEIPKKWGRWQGVVRLCLLDRFFQNVIYWYIMLYIDFMLILSILAFEEVYFCLLCVVLYPTGRHVYELYLKIFLIIYYWITVVCICKINFFEKIFCQ